MRLRRAILFAIGVPLAAVVSYKLMYPTYVWRQKLTVEVQVGNEVRSASSVSEMRVTFMPKILPESHEFDIKLRGEAVVLNVTPSSALFALLNKMENISIEVFKDMLPRDSARSDFSTLAALREPRDVPRDRYPLLVTFGDIADPKTVRRVDPDDLAASFGRGVSLRRITLAITDEEVTEGKVEQVLPWLSDPGVMENPGWKVLPLETRRAISGLLSDFPNLEGSSK